MTERPETGPKGKAGPENIALNVTAPFPPNY